MRSNICGMLTEIESRISLLKIDCAKFDKQPERGAAAGARLRKELRDIIDQCKQARSQIALVKVARRKSKSIQIDKLKRGEK